MRISKSPEIRKHELIEVALKLFRDRGYDKASVEQITKQAGVAKGVFYYYFSSKEEMLSACIEALAQPLLQEYIAILTDEGIDPFARLQRYVNYNFDIFEKRRGNQLEQTLHSPTGQGIHDRMAKEFTGALHPHFEAIIEAGKSAGEFQIDDARFTATALLGALTALHERYADVTPTESSGLRANIDALIDQILNRRA